MLIVEDLSALNLPRMGQRFCSKIQCFCRGCIEPPCGHTGQPVLACQTPQIVPQSIVRDPTTPKKVGMGEGLKMGSTPQVMATTRDDEALIQNMPTADARMASKATERAEHRRRGPVRQSPTRPWSWGKLPAPKHCNKKVHHVEQYLDHA
jgi:hypothetical protein